MQKFVFQQSAITILMADRLDAQRVLVSFSDGTMAAFYVQELLELRPDRSSLGGDLQDEPE